MPIRRARPTLPILCLPLMLAAAAAFAAQQDLAQPDLTRSDLTRSGALQPGMSSQPTPVDASESLIAWPCLDTPGCAVDERGARAELASDAELPAPTAIPLPAALGLMGAGLAALGLVMRRPRG